MQKNVFGQPGLRVSVIGLGAIGKRVASEIKAGRIAGAEFAGAVVRREGSATAEGFKELSLDEAIETSDLIIESAGGEAAANLGPSVIAAGKNLLIISVGALADENLRETLLAGPGKLFVAAGAIGGLDILSSVARDGGLKEAKIASAKLPGTLVQPWMGEQEAAAVRDAKEPTVIFSGTVQEAIKKFPKSLNVAVALAHATGLWKETTVNLVADPAATLTTHTVEANGTAGSYTFQITNSVAPDNPATSMATAESLLNAVVKLAGNTGVFV